MTNASNTAAPPIAFRPGTIHDVSFIFSSWLKSYRTNPKVAGLSKDNYFRLYKKIVADILSRSSVQVACDPSDPNQIYAYAVYHFDRGVLVLHWVNTKYTYRQLGIAKSLLISISSSFGSDVTACTHSTRIFGKLKDKYNLLYKPE